MSTTERSESMLAEQGAALSGSPVDGPTKAPPRFGPTAPQVGLQFASGEELDAAIDWLWSAPELRELPRIHVGQSTMIVPEEALEQFRQKGYHFAILPVVSA